MEPALLLNSPKCSSESVSQPGAWLCFTEPPFFRALMYLNTSRIYNASLNRWHWVSVYHRVTRAGSGNTGGSGQLQSCTIKFQSVQGESSLVSAASASPRNNKKPKHSKIGYHIELHQLLQLNIPSFIHAKKNGLPEGEKYKLKMLFLISFDSLSCPLQEKLEDSFI